MSQVNLNQLAFYLWISQYGSTNGNNRSCGTMFWVYSFGGDNQVVVVELSYCDNMIFLSFAYSFFHHFTVILLCSQFFLEKFGIWLENLLTARVSISKLQHVWVQKKEKVQTCGEELRATRIAIAFCEKRGNNAGQERWELFRGAEGIIMIRDEKSKIKLQDIIFSKVQ